MGIFIDVFLVSILAINIIIGYKKGLIKLVINIFAFLISIIVTIFLFRPISTLVIDNTQIDDTIQNAIIELMDNDTNEDNLTDEEVDKNKTTDNSSNLKQLKSYIEEKIKDEADKTRQEALNVVANNIALRATEVLTAIGLFIIIRILLIVLSFFAESLGEIPIVKQLNKSGGIAYGIIKSIVIIFILLTIFYFVVLLKPHGIIASAIEQSYITKILYENNIIVNFIR